MDCTCEDCTGAEIPEHAILEVVDAPTGDRFRVRVHAEHQHDPVGWGDRPRLRFKAGGAEVTAIETGRDADGVNAVDTAGRVHRLRHHGAFTRWHPVDGDLGGELDPPTHVGVPQLLGAPLRKAGLGKVVGRIGRQQAEGNKARVAAAAERGAHDVFRDAGGRPKPAPAPGSSGGGASGGSHGALKPGQRWITVHPNGPDEKGVPILISPNPDGTMRVIAGAGGKLTHLRLKNVKSEEEMRQAAREKAIGKAAAEKERKAGLTPEQRDQERVAKKQAKLAKETAERDFVQHVRSKLGGVSEDLDETKLAGLTEGAANLLRSRHHKQQLREAMERTGEAAKKLVAHHVEQATADTMVREAVEGDPVVSQEAHDLAALELELRDQEEEERRAERNVGAARVASPAADVGEAAADAALQTLDKIPDTGKRLEELGGRLDAPAARERGAEDTGKASDELQRRAAEALDNAKRMADAAKLIAAKGDEADLAALLERGDDPTTKKIVETALERAGLDLTAPPEQQARVLKREAARQVRRAEIQDARAKGLKKLEGDEGGDAKARGALAFSDLLSGIADSVATAKKLGLVDSERTPLQEPEIAELRDVLKSAADLRAKQKAFRGIVKAAEKGDYDRSRRAFDLHVEAAPDTVERSIQEDVQRDLTERLLGIANPKAGAHVEAVAAGHYNGLADVALGVADQRYIGRAVVDAVGVGNAALLMRHAMESDGHDPKAVLAALERHHVASITRESTKAIEQANRAIPGLSSSVEDVGDIERAMAQLDAYEGDVDDAQRSVGSALGKLEATATLGQAFRQPLPNEFRLEAPGGNLDTQLAWLQAAGLQAGDYTVVNNKGEGKAIVVPRSSWDKMINRVPKEEIERRHAVEAIKRGDEDQEGWLPEGIVRRSETSFTAPTPAAPRFYQPLELHAPGDWRANLEQHVGSRLAEGEQPHEILTDLMSPQVADTSPDRDAYFEHLRSLFPLKDEEGRAAKYEEHAEHFQALADKYMSAKYGPTSGGFHAQDIHVDDKGTHEAIFRTLAEDPALALAHKPTGTLTASEQGTLREQFYRLQAANAAAKAIGPRPPITDKAGNEAWAKKVKAARDEAIKRPAERRGDDTRYRAALESIGPEPEKLEGSGSMFGGPPATRPEWTAWAARRDGVFAKFPKEALAEATKALPPAPGPNASRAERERHAQALGKLEELKTAAAMAPSPWAAYVQAHGSLELAQQAIQDEMRGRFAERFREHYGKVTGRGLRVGVQPITNQERHVAAIDPEEAERLKAEARATYAKIQNRVGGKFGAEGGEGGLRQKFTNWLEDSTVAQQNQGALYAKAKVPAAEEAPELGGGLFGAPKPKPKPAIPPDTTPAPKVGERLSLGARAEAALASLVGRVGGQFNPKGGATGLFPGLNMDGDRVHQQRVIRMMDQNGGRVGGFLGTGSGKSLISIGAFTHQHAQGRTKHGLYLVPVAVQSQFGSEMLRYTEPGKYRWGTGEGKSHEERVAMLKDPSVHMRVMTHASYRDTALKLMAEHQGVSTDAMRQKLKASHVDERAKWLRDAFDANGIPPHFVYNDEAHGSTEREGADPSLWNRIATATSHPINATHYLHGTATPAKNDESEIYSTAAMLDPKRYGDRAEFMQAFGSDVDKNPESLRRELSHLIYTAKIDPEGVDRVDSDNPEITPDGKKVTNGAPIPLEGAHRKRVDEVTAAYQRAREATARGGVDVEALKTLSPARFAATPKEDHEKIARELSRSLGIIRESAMRRAVNQAPAGENVKLKRMGDVIEHDLKHGTWTDPTGAVQQGRPSIVFTDSKAEADLIHEHLQSRGIRSAAYHGGLNTREREAIVKGFQPEGKGATPSVDVIVATSSAEAGVNLQRAKAVHHYDVPQTAKSHQQRSGRAYRQGQQGDVDIHNWYTDADYEQRARRRLDRKSGLASVLQDPVGSLDETGIAAEYHRELAERHQDADTIESLAAK